jgi:hypothetical protein
MMPEEKPLLVDGRTWGSVCTFEKAGDEMPVHSHGGDNHITLVMYGGIRCNKGVEYHARPGGTIINWAHGEPHGFAALVDGTTVANIIKNARPT